VVVLVPAATVALTITLAVTFAFAFDGVAPPSMLGRRRGAVVVNVVHSRSVLLRSRLLDNTFIIFPFPLPLDGPVLGLLIPVPLCGLGGHCGGHRRRSTSGDPTALWLLHLLLPLGGNASVGVYGRLG